MSTNIQNNNTDQTTKVVPLFTSKVNVSDKSSKKGDKKERLVAPKNLIAQTSNHKPHLDVGYHRVASSYARQFKDLNQEEFKSALGQFGLTSDNYKEYAEAARKVLGDEQFGEILTGLLKENGISPEEALQSLHEGGFADKTPGANPDPAPNPGDGQALKNAAKHFINSVQNVNPFLMSVTMGQRESEIENQGLQNEARQSQTENNKLTKVNTSMSAEASNIQSEAKSQPWWERVLKLVIVTVGAIIATAVFTAAFNFFAPAALVAVDGLAAALNIGADATEAVTEAGIDAGADAGTDLGGIKEGKKESKVPDDDKSSPDDADATSNTGSNDTIAEANAANQRENDAIKTKEKRAKAANDIRSADANMGNDKAETKEIGGDKKSYREKVKERYAAKRAKHLGPDGLFSDMKNKFASLDNYTVKGFLMGTLLLTCAGATIWSQILSGIQKGNIATSQTEAMSMQNVAQSIDINLNMINTLTNAYLQANQTIAMGEATALNYAYTADTVKA